MWTPLLSWPLALLWVLCCSPAASGQSVAVEIQASSSPVVFPIESVVQNDNGAVKFGSALDVNLYRTGGASGHLKTDNSLEVAGGELLLCYLLFTVMNISHHGLYFIVGSGASLTGANAVSGVLFNNGAVSGASSVSTTSATVAGTLTASGN